jgi:hypothetical protein
MLTRQEIQVLIDAGGYNFYTFTGTSTGVNYPSWGPESILTTEKGKIEANNGKDANWSLSSEYTTFYLSKYTSEDFDMLDVLGFDNEVNIFIIQSIETLEWAAYTLPFGFWGEMIFAGRFIVGSEGLGNSTCEELGFVRIFFIEI